MIESADDSAKNPKKVETSSNTPVLDNFSRDLIKLAEEGKLDPVVGRENEILRIAQILSRRKKNNPIKVRFCFIAIAKKSENKVPPMSNKNIIHLGTILKFLNMMFVFCWIIQRGDCTNYF